MADNTQQQQDQTAPESIKWLAELQEKLLADLPEKFKDENIKNLSAEQQNELFDTAAPEEKEKLGRLHVVTNVIIGLQQNKLGIQDVDRIKAGFEAAEAAKKDPFKSIADELQTAAATFRSAQRKPSSASGITQDGVPLTDFEAEDPDLDGDSGPSAISRFAKRFRKKPLNEVLHGHWPGYNPNGPMISQLAEFIDVSRYKDNVKKTGNLHFKVKGGGTICWRPGNTEQPEFIGRTNLQSRFGKKPLKEADANAIMSIAKARGWQSINLHGTSAEKNELWLAAMKQGINVPESNFIPSDEYRAKWERYQKSSGFEAQGFAGASETPPAQQAQANTVKNEAPTAADSDTTTAPKGPAKGTAADAADVPAAPARGTTNSAQEGKTPAKGTKFVKTGDDKPAAPAQEDDAADKAPKAGRGKGRQP